MIQDEVVTLPNKIVEVETYPISKPKKKLLLYLVIGRIKSSDALPWIQFQTDDYEKAKSELALYLAEETNKTYKIETRTITGEELDEFIKSKKEVEMLIKQLNSK